MNNGIYTDISHDAYHAMKDRVSNSYLGRLDSCPAKAQVEQEETDALRIGRAFHVLTLEGEEAYNRECAIAPECNKRTNAGKEAWAAFIGMNPGKIILTAEENQALHDMSKSVLLHPFAFKLLNDGRSEVSVLWTDEATGIDCKARPDRVPEGNKGVIVDLKSVRDASEHAFTNAVVNFGWHREAGIYIEGFNAATKGKVDSFVFIACEKEPPYRTEVYVLDDDFIAFGRAEFHRLLNIEKQCREAKFYPHYTNPGASELTMPRYLTSGGF